jgi:hypothetical protein
VVGHVGDPLGGRGAPGTPLAPPFAEEDCMASKRELIEPHPGDKRYVRRDEKGQFKESDDVGRSLAQDRKRKAKTVSKPGQGDRGDRST